MRSHVGLINYSQYLLDTYYARYSLHISVVFFNPHDAPYPRFADEEIVAQSSGRTCLRSHCQQVADPGFQPRCQAPSPGHQPSRSRKALFTQRKPTLLFNSNFFSTRTQRSDLWLPRGRGGGGGKDWEPGISRCELSHVGWINDKALLCSAGNYVQYPVTDHNGKELVTFMYNSVTLLYSRN